MAHERKFGLIDRIIEKLPAMHFRGYRYCGPNTNLAARLARGEHGINELDCACMDHDIAYAESKDLKSRCIADKLLFLRAIKRVFAKNSKIGERFAALIVSLLIGVKMTFGRIELCFRKCFAMKTK